MSGITSLLGGLLHQVLGKPADLPPVSQDGRPVEPIAPNGAVRTVHSDSRLDARSHGLSSSLLQNLQQGDEAAQLVGGASVSSTTQLSPAARTIADVLLEHPAKPSAIMPATPLLPSVDTPPVASLLATLLRQSFSESGLFYEAHLARWYRGELPLQALAREPQMGGRRPPGEGTAPSPRAAGGVPSSAPMAFLPETIDSELLPALSSSIRAEAPLQAGPALSQEQLQGLVRHQLELLVSPALRWEGEAWPGLFMSLFMQAPEAEQQDPGRQDRHGGVAVQQKEAEWCLRLDLELPGHGALRIDARLGVQSLSLTMSTASKALLDYFSRTEGLLRERIGQCCPGEIKLRCLDARQVVESGDE